MIDRILVPLDLSQTSETVLDSLAPFLHRNEAELTFLHVMPEGATEQYSWEAWRAVTSIQERYLSKGLTVWSQLRSGEPAAGILGYAGAYQPSLIAMYTHARSGVARLVRGSVAEQVLRHSPFPLFLAPPAIFAAGVEGHRILVPLDGSETSAAILPLVTEFAKLFNSEVILLHVWTSFPAEPMAEVAARTIFHSAEKEGEKILAPLVERLKGQGVRARSFVCYGYAADEILRVAGDEQVNLLAMSTHGRTGLARVMWGSVTEAVLRRCAIPLLVRRSIELSSEREFQKEPKVVATAA